jgi:hypothetical protein
MEKQLLKLAISILCFAISLTINLLDENLILRAITFFGGFMSGWGVCYSIECMFGGINEGANE